MLAKLYTRIFIFSLPLCVVLFYFFFTDPFGIFYNKTPIALSSDDTKAFESFDRLYPAHSYNSFIFGNSRTLAFKNKDWRQYASVDRSFSFGVPGECIYNIYKKTAYILRQGPIDHALVVLDWEMLLNHRNSAASMQGPAYLHHPKSSDLSYLDYYVRYLNYYFQDFFYAKYITYLATGRYTAWMKDAFNRPGEKRKPLSVHNESDESAIEAEMERDFTAYYRDHDFSVSKIGRPANIHEDDMISLRKIKKLFDQGNTDYRIIISPNYRHVALNGSIIDSLNSVFGRSHVFDFSGKNITGADSTFYIEPAHYSSKLGSKILAEVYASKQDKNIRK